MKIRTCKNVENRNQSMQKDCANLVILNPIENQGKIKVCVLDVENIRSVTKVKFIASTVIIRFNIQLIELG